MLRIVKYICSAAAGIVLLFIIVSIVLEFRPKQVMPVEEYSGLCDTLDSGTIPDTVRIVTWNIGYAGLGDNMDFCIDGGDKVRDSRERTISNLEAIIKQLHRFDADILLLQEVDRKAHRTYGTDEVRLISESFPGYFVYYAPNFKVWFVPKPLKEPIGNVNSGLVILSRIKPSAVRRIQYPSRFPFPVSMFNLKRCILEADFNTSGGKLLHLGNSHCTAFDTGGMRTVENCFLKSRIASHTSEGDLSIIGGDWNQYPPEYTPGKAELENKFFVPEKFDTCGMNANARIVCDACSYSVRFNDAPYSLSSTKSLLDFFVVSNAGMKTLSVHTVNLDFHNSDHNPVVIDLKIF